MKRGGGGTLEGYWNFPRVTRGPRRSLEAPDNYSRGNQRLLADEGLKLLA
jgi:hypothetical protein